MNHLNADGLARLWSIINAKFNRLNHVTQITLTASGWSGTAAPYTQTVSVGGITEGMEPILVKALDIGATEATQKAYEKAFAIVSAGIGMTGNGTVTFKVYKKPATTIAVGLRGA